MAARGRPRGFDRTAALRKAMEVFWRQGYEGTSMVDLTTAMEINSPSLYAAFGCKEALFREAVALYGTAEGAASRRALVEQPTARRAVDAMLRDSARIFADRTSPAGCLVTLGAVCGPDGDAAVRDHLRDRRREIHDLLHARLARGIADGELGPGTDPAAVAAFYNTVLQGLSLQARDGASPQTLIAIVDCAMAAWDGLTGQITAVPGAGRASAAARRSRTTASS